MDRGAWRATVQRVTKESDMTEQLTHTHIPILVRPYPYCSLSGSCDHASVQEAGKQSSRGTLDGPDCPTYRDSIRSPDSSGPG